MTNRKTRTLLHLENLVAELVAKFPLREKPVLPGETENLEAALKIPCLEWDRGKVSNKYGCVYINGKQAQATRVAYAMVYGPVSPSLHVCHHCDNPPCINPHHLFAGTQAQNLADMRAKGRHAKGYGPKGSSNSKSIYSSDQVVSMRSQFSNGVKIGSLRDQFGGSYHSIWAIVHGLAWKHLL